MKRDGFRLDPVAEWDAMMDGTNARVMAKQFGLAWPPDENDELPAILALRDLGLALGRVVAEPRQTVRAGHGERDADLGRDRTIHLAPQWRAPIVDDPMFPAEKGTPALILPVAHRQALPLGGGEEISGWTELHPATGMGRIAGAFDGVMSYLRDGDAFAETIADLVAIPLGGGRPLSRSGYTVAVGRFEPAASGTLTIFASGKAWLAAHLARVRTIAEDTPPHLVAETLMPFAPPEGVLLIEPRAFEWRVCRYDCVLPETVTEIRCPDSPALAAFIDGAMRKKERVRTLPTVLGPAQKARAAA